MHEGTVMVGAVPAVPAADRSAFGMVVGGPEVVGVVEGAVVDVLAVDELLHPARAIPDTASTAIDQVRTLFMGFLSRGVMSMQWRRPGLLGRR